MKESPNRYYPQLTGVRALAAFCIFFHHYPSAFLGKTLQAMQAQLHIGVPIFFTLSGFLIYLRYSETCQLKKEWLFSYFKNRFAKIYPFYFFIILLQCCVLGGSLFDFLMQATFIKGFSSEYKFIGVAQGWSLTVEETFYILFPFLLLFIKRTGLLVTLLAVYGMGGVLLKIGTAVNKHSFFMPDFFMSYYTFFGQAGQFFMGMFLAKYILTHESKGSIKRKFPINFTLLGLLGLIFCVYCFAKIGFTGTGFAPIGLLLNHSLLPGCVALFFYGLLTQKSWFRTVLESKLSVLLGKSSYIFYLIHAGIFYQLLTQNVSNQLWIVFILLNILAVIFYFTIESPCHKFIRNIGKRSSKQLLSTQKEG